MKPNTTKAFMKATLVCGSSLAALMAAPSSAQTVCVPNPLTGVDCTPTLPTDPIDLPGLTDPVTVNLPDGLDSINTVAIDSTGPITIDGDAVIATVLDGQPALDLTSGADIFAQVTSLSTEGDGAIGAVLEAVDDVILIVDETVTTLGDNADGINITAGSAAVTVDEVRTAGVESDGVEIVTLSGPATLNADLIETLGDGSTAAILRAAGDIGVDVGVLRSEGDQALGLDLQTDATACAVLGSGSCDVSAVADSITTDGFGSIGALVSAAGNTDIAVDVLQTGGDEAAGLDLSADPAACVALGVGGCDTAFTVQNLTTNGARAPGAVVRAVGDIDGNVGVLTTDGEDSVGLDLASDPDACVILGAGGCETSFSVGQLTTNGDGATGALVRAAGPTTANIGLLETFGDDATGIDLAADPEACVLLGLGQCDTAITGDTITTNGDRSIGALIAAPADIVADFGTVETFGEDSPAVQITGDPEACVLLGTGACDTTLTADRIATDGANSGGVLVNSPGTIVADLGLVDTNGDGSSAITLVTDPAVCALLGEGSCGVTLGGGDDGMGTEVDTDGDDSPGVVVESPGPVDIDVDDVDTDGDNSPGIDVDGGEGPIMVDFGDVTTDGDNSPGVDVSGTGTIDITGDSVNTGGDGSPGVLVVGDDDPVTVDVGMVVTTGDDSNGIDVTTTTGDQTIVSGGVMVSGTNSNGIVATATGCGSIDITATGPVSAANGIGIDAESACDVTIRTLDGAPVSGAVKGIEATSGTGTTVVIGDALSSSNGAAIDVDGASANLRVLSGGSITGVIDLTDADDILTNQGTLFATASSSFGAGDDLLVNRGTISVNGAQTYAGLETLANAALIDMRDGDTEDSLTLPGDYVGSANAALGVDVAAGTASDTLIVGGAATGSTQLLVAGLDGSFVNGATVLDAGAGTSANALSFDGQTVGFTDYSLTFDAASNDYSVFGIPNESAVSTALLAGAAREIFYRGNEAVAGHLGSLGTNGGTNEQPDVDRALWLVGFGQTQNRDLALDAAPFGQARTYMLDSSQDWFGVQAGGDLFGGANSAVGVTAGYMTSKLQLDTRIASADYDAYNVGVYGRTGFGPLFINALVKYERYSLDYEAPGAGLAADIDGDGWGGWIEAGARLGSDALQFVPKASIEYANIDFDGFTASGTGFDLGADDGLRGKAGLTLRALFSDTPGMLYGYAGAQVIHEFKGDDTVTLTNNGGTLDFGYPGIDTYGRASIGLDYATGVNPIRGFFEGTFDFGSGVSGAGARAGLSIPF